MVVRGGAPVTHVIHAPATLGRTVKCDDGAAFELDDDRMSREHAHVRFERGHWIVADRESRNGTFVNGQRISGEVRRRGDCIVRLGHSVFVLLADATGHETALDDTAHVVGPELARVYDRIRAAAASSSTLFIHGEAGSGKELAARVFHEASPRRGGPFVSVSCPTIPEGVAERLLFGARKGIVESIGHFQMARGGTIFLDEIASLGGNVQTKLMRLIERGAIEPVGTTEATPIDIAVVAAGHAELRLAVADGRFDAELYKRLGTAAVSLPPLRERRVDIARLVQREVAAVDGKLAAHAKLVEACLIRQWPGNVRELLTAIRKAATGVLAQKRDSVRVEDLDPAAGLTAGALAAETAVERPSNTPPAEIDKAAIEAALVRANGVVHIAARILGIHRSQLYQLMDKHGIVFTDE
jgi:DNA-binding NtrC family response regulator